MDRYLVDVHNYDDGGVYAYIVTADDPLDAARKADMAHYDAKGYVWSEGTYSEVHGVLKFVGKYDLKYIKVRYPFGSDQE